MFSELITKLNSFGGHHQVLFALIIGLCLIAMTWSIEHILEEYILPNKPWYGYISVIILSLLLLWLIKHVILHVM